MIIMPINSWSTYKTTVITNKKLFIQYSESATNYEIFAEESGFYWTISLVKGGSDATDFENNYKATANQPLGVSTKPFSVTDGFKGRLKGYTGTANANQTSNHDFLIAEDRYIQGGELILKNQTVGDYVKFQIIDKDNVLGYGQNVVLDEFVDTWYVADDKQGQDVAVFNYVAKIYAGLYIRLVYVNTSLINTVSVYLNLYLHKKVI